MGLGLGNSLPCIPVSRNRRLKNRYLLTPVESALTEKRPVTPLESALPKTLDLKSFRIRTCGKGWGEGLFG